MTLTLDTFDACITLREARRELGRIKDALAKRKRKPAVQWWFAISRLLSNREKGMIRSEARKYGVRVETW